MVKLRLRRVGKKKQPVYKIVAAQSQASRNGKYLDAIGQYNPMINPMIIDVNEEKLYQWLKRGAQPTDTVRSLLQRKGLWMKWGLMKKGADEATITSELEKWQMLQAEKLQREVARKSRRKAVLKKRSEASATPAATPAPAPEAESVPAVPPVA